MTNMIPYTPWHPIEDDAMFQNQEATISRVLRIVHRPVGQRRCCAIIGGPGMGKSSILKHIKRGILAGKFHHYAILHETTIIPIYIDLHGWAQTEDNQLRTLLKRIIVSIKQELIRYVQQVLQTETADLTSRSSFLYGQLDQSTSTHRVEVTDAFLLDLQRIIQVIEEKIGRVRLIVLIDHLHEALANKPELTMAFSETILALLSSTWSDIDLRPYVSLVFACKDSIGRQFPKDRIESLIHVIEPIYLRPLHSEPSSRLIQEPLASYDDHDLASDMVAEIYAWMGGHPRLLSLFMLHYCEEYVLSSSPRKLANSTEIESLALTTALNYGDLIPQIVDTIAEHPISKSVFDILRVAPTPLSYQDIRIKLDSIGAPYFDLDTALATLEFLGIASVQGNPPTRTVSLSGKICQQWFGSIADSLDEDLPLVW